MWKWSVFSCYIPVIIAHRSGTAEEKTEKHDLLREVSDLMDAGYEILQEKKRDQKEHSKQTRKKLMLQKKGQDIRLHAMQALKGNYEVVRFQRFYAHE